MQRFFIALGIALGALVPAFAFAQTSGTGLLNVYVLVSNQNGTTYAPQDFTVSVSGNSPSITTFSGSQNGTAVVLNPGSYAVTAAGASGFTPSYSVGCNNTIAAGQSQTCVVTMAYTYNYYQNPSIYPYPYQYIPPLSCRTVTPTVGLGQSARFEAIGGQGGTYNWSTPFQNYPNVGPVLTVSFSSSGWQLVRVTNAAQTATCTIDVTNSYNPVATSGYTYPSYSYPGYTYPGYTTGYQTYPNLAYQNYYPAQQYLYPSFPRTGFAPHNLALAGALASVLLIAAGIATAPYVRKTLAFVTR